MTLSLYCGLGDAEFELGTYNSPHNHLATTSTYNMTELGTRQPCCDNVTMFSGLIVVGFSILICLLYSLWQLHLDTETLIFFEFFLVPEALLRSCVVDVAKLKKLPRAQLCKIIFQVGS